MSVNQKMESQVEYLVETLEKYGEFHLTIYIQEHEKLKNHYIENRAEVLTYKGNPNCKFPWTICPRWNIEPKSDLVIGIDTDVAAVNQYSDIGELLEYDIAGVIAGKNPLSLEQWTQLFKEAGVVWTGEIYQTSDGLAGPYYVNNGVVSLRSELLPAMQEEFEKMLRVTNKHLYDSFFIVQITTTLAACSLALNKGVMPWKYNHSTELGDLTSANFEHVVFYHYIHEKNEFLVGKRRRSFLI